MDRANGAFLYNRHWEGNRSMDLGSTKAWDTEERTAGSALLLLSIVMPH